MKLSLCLETCAFCLCGNSHKCETSDQLNKPNVRLPGEFFIPTWLALWSWRMYLTGSPPASVGVSTTRAHAGHYLAEVCSRVVFKWSSVMMMTKVSTSRECPGWFRETGIKKKKKSVYWWSVGRAWEGEDEGEQGKKKESSFNLVFISLIMNVRCAQLLFVLTMCWLQYLLNFTQNSMLCLLVA